MTNVSEELVERALEPYEDALWLEDLSRTDLNAFTCCMRAAIEAVLPDIERPLRAEIWHWRSRWEERGAFIEGMTKLLVERDEEIKRLGREIEEWKATAEALEDPLSRETLLTPHSFSDAEREALLERLDGRVRWGWRTDAYKSARAKLEQER